VEPRAVAADSAPARVDSAGAPQDHGEAAAAEYAHALARVMDPSAPPGPALRSGLRAMLGSDTLGLMGWTELGSLESSSDLAISLSSGTRRVPARPHTRSCGDRPDCRAVAMTVRATNASAAPVHLTLREEWHGGAFPPTSVVLCARPRSSDAGAATAGCSPGYVVESHPKGELPISAPREIELAPGATTSFEVRLDWAGTGSMIGAPLVDPLLAASYYVEAGLLFETGGQRRVSYSEVETVSVPSL